jgi:chromosome segregation ATPase
MRPNISEDLAAEVDDAVRAEIRVPPSRLTFDDRVRVLLEEYHDADERAGALEERVAELEDTVEEYKHALEDRDDRISDLKSRVEQQQGGVLGR